MQLLRGGMPVTDQQAAIVDHVKANPVTVASAGAGSGKTYTVIATVLELLETRNATMDQFVLITFTRKAAGELRGRIGEALRTGAQSAATSADRQFWLEQQERLASAFVGTIHAFCLDILHRYGYAQGVAGQASVSSAGRWLDESLREALDESLTVFPGALLHKDFRWDEHAVRGFAHGVLDHIRNHDLDAGVVRDETERQPDGQGRRQRMAMAHLVHRADELFTARKNAEHILDTTDILRRTADLLHDPAVVERVARRYRCLFIDEFQDTDRAQKRIADALRAKFHRLLVVGDTKQSIYGWRAAEKSLLAELAQATHGTPLPLNYSRRPTRPLLDVLNALFGAISDRYPDLGEPLQAPTGAIKPRDALAPLTIISVSSSAQDDRITTTADYIARTVGQPIDDRPGQIPRTVVPGDIVILLRSNANIRRYEQGLQQRLAGTGIQVRAEVGGAFFQRSEILATYHMLHLALDYPNDTLLRVAHETSYLRDVDARERVQYLMQYGSKEGFPLFDWFEHHYPTCHKRLAALRDAVRTDTVPQFLARLYELFDIQAFYRAQGDAQAAENLDRLRELARELVSNEQALTLRQFVGWLEIAFATGREEREAESGSVGPIGTPPYVRLMTIHQAKGLEFPIVIIPEIQTPVLSASHEPEYLVIPGWGLDLNLMDYGMDTRSPRFSQELMQHAAAHREEEMRLLYVAATRAQHSVVLVGSRGYNTTPRPPNSPDYSWQDEVRRAWPGIRDLGATIQRF